MQQFPPIKNSPAPTSLNNNWVTGEAATQGAKPSPDFKATFHNLNNKIAALEDKFQKQQEQIANITHQLDKLSQLLEKQQQMTDNSNAALNSITTAITKLENISKKILKYIHQQPSSPSNDQPTKCTK